MTKNVKKVPGLKALRVGFGILIFLVFLFSFFIKTNAEAAEGEVPPAPVCNLSDVKKDNKSWILPDCVYFEGTTKEQDCGCRNVNVFIQLLVKFSNVLFSIVGAAALVMFVYGGYTFLASAGTAEKVTKGKKILVAAVIGLVIVFVAQFGVKFLLKIVVKEGSTSGLEVVNLENAP